jgi:hypothetical protein
MAINGEARRISTGTGGDPRPIWPGRVFAHRTFDSTDPQVSPHAEPDVTGNGHNLTYIYLGTSREHNYAQFATPTNPQCP